MIRNKIKNKIKNSKKGFTLVELIVVLVILAVLAAILLPALLGYIDKAKSEKSLTNAAAFYKAVQSVGVEEYAFNTTYTKSAGFSNTTYEAVTNDRPYPKNKNNVRIRAIYDLMDASQISEKFYAIAKVEGGKVTRMAYMSVEAKRVWEWTIASATWKEIPYQDNFGWVDVSFTRHISINKQKIWWNGDAPGY